MNASPSEWIAGQLRPVRERRRYTQAELAAAVTQIGHPMHQTQVAKIERGERRATIDDVFALAAALDVSPLALILPRSNEGVRIGHVAVRGDDAWSWVLAQVPLTRYVVAGTTWENPSYRAEDLAGRTLTDKEADDRIEFFRSEVSDQQRRIRSTPGAAHLERLTTQYLLERARSSPDRIRQRELLGQLAAEVQRQAELLDMDDRKATMVGTATLDEGGQR